MAEPPLTVCIKPSSASVELPWPDDPSLLTNKHMSGVYPPWLLHFSSSDLCAGLGCQEGRNPWSKISVDKRVIGRIRISRAWALATTSKDDNTTYPDACYKTLSSYAAIIQTSPTELAKEALSVSLNSAQLTSDVVANLSKMSDLTKRESGAVNDCMEMISDSAEELRQSLVAMRDLQGPEFKAQMDNIETWVSAALTDEDTCMDGFNSGKGPNKGKVKGIIRSNVVRVAQLTSNALALVNRLSE